MPLNEAYQASTVQRDESHRACEDVFLTSVSENAYRPSAERLPVPLLRVCTQIHEECAKILYETNTYEFSVPSTFFKFLKMLRAHHTQYLWKISFWISWMVDDWSIMMHSYLGKNPSLPLPLQSIKILFVCESMTHIRPLEDTTEGILEKRNLGWIWRLKFPVLKTAQIIAVDLQIADDDWPGRYDDRDEWLSVAQKKKVREDIESRLLTNRS